MATPREAKKAVDAYKDNRTPDEFEKLKKLVSETTFTHQPAQVYGEDPYWDPDSFEDNIWGLTYEETKELRELARFVEED